MQLTFHTLDVFTGVRFGGNPLAVVLEADDLSTEQMQVIAREFALSETVFVLKPQNSTHTAALRIFTPTREIPFAGHPTVGTAALLAHLRLRDVGGERDQLVIFEQGIGSVRVGVRLGSEGQAFAEFDAPKLPQEAGVLPPVERLAAGLGLIPNESGFENHRPLCFAAGNTFAFIPVISLKAIGRAFVNLEHWASGFEEQGIVGAYLYTRECVHTTSAFHARMFAPMSGVMEDPATGSAAICLSGAVHYFDKFPDGTHKRLIEQGYEMGRKSMIEITSIVAGGMLETVRIGGRSVAVSEGKITI